MTKTAIKDGFEQLILMIAVGSFGGIISQLNSVRKGRPFKLGIGIINLILSGWTGGVVYGFLPESFTQEFIISIVSVSGALSFKFIDWVESEGFNLILEKAGLKK